MAPNHSGERRRDPLLNPADQVVIPVLGMHRCGTSMVTRLLNILGMELGWPLQPASTDNPKGFWEHRLFQAVNIKVLKAIGHHGDGYGTMAELMSAAQTATTTSLPDSLVDNVRQQLAQSFMAPVWGFKDPRCMLLWPMWQQMLTAFGYPDIRPIIVVRQPGSCAQSLKHRGDVTSTAAAAGVDLDTYLEEMWGAYYHIILKSSAAALNPLIICQENLLDPQQAPTEIARLANHIGVDSSQCQAALNWIDIRMDHSTSADHSAAEPIQSIYDALYQLSSDQRQLFVEKTPEAVPVPTTENSTLVDSTVSTHCIYIVSPLGYPHANCFQELAESLHFGLAEMGIDAPIVRDRSRVQGTPIVLGANLAGKFIDTSAASLDLPDDAIIYNLEQVDEDSTWIDDAYLSLLRRHTVWDYSTSNVDKLAHMGVNVDGVCSIGHVRQLERIPAGNTKDIDVLFYGSTNERRLTVLNSLRERGLNVVISTNLYGENRDALVARSKVVLNIHYYEAKVLELVRISYLMANGAAVVSEKGADRNQEASLADAIAFADYGDLVETCIHLVENPDQAAILGERARSEMQSRPQVSYLKALLH